MYSVCRVGQNREYLYSIIFGLKVPTYCVYMVLADPNYT